MTDRDTDTASSSNSSDSRPATNPAVQFFHDYVTPTTRWPILGRDNRTGEIILSNEFRDALPAELVEMADKPRRHFIWEILVLWYLTVYRGTRRKCPVMEGLLKADWNFRFQSRGKRAGKKKVPGRALPDPRSAKELFIREKMRKYGIKSYSELERKSGVKRQSIAHYATGKRGLSAEAAIALARTFEEPIEGFLVQLEALESGQPQGQPDSTTPTNNRKDNRMT